MIAGKLFTGSAQVAAVRYGDLPGFVRRPFEIPSGITPGVMLEDVPDIDED